MEPAHGSQDGLTLELKHRIGEVLNISTLQIVIALK